MKSIDKLIQFLSMALITIGIFQWEHSKILGLIFILTGLYIVYRIIKTPTK